jgi:hypothetical protein
MTPAEAAKAVLMLQAAYPAARWTEATVELYEAMLSDLDTELVRGAIARHICTSKFMPTVAEVREAAADIAVGPSRSGVEAWGDVGMAIRRTGSYGAPKFEDPLVAECVRIMGWRNLCLGDSPEAADRARFCELYTDLQRKQRQHDVSAPGRLLPAGRAPAQLSGNVRELTARVGTGPLQPNHGKTGSEKARRL